MMGQITWHKRSPNAEECVYGCVTGVVYFITLGEPAIWVKIGFTAGDPNVRMKALQTGCPYPMTLRGFVPGNEAMERELHAVLAEYRRSGEWFEYSEYVHSIIQGRLEAMVTA